MDTGIEEGRLLRDRRLHAFLNREDEESVDGTEPRARATRSIAIGEYEKWVAEKRLSGLTRRLEKRERRLEEVRSRLERARTRE